MQRILLTLIKIMVTIKYGYPLTKQDEAIVYRYASDEIKNIEKQLDELAEKVYKERIYIRNDSKKPTVPLHPGYGSEWKLQRGEGDDRLDYSGSSWKKD